MLVGGGGGDGGGGAAAAGAGCAPEAATGAEPALLTGGATGRACGGAGAPTTAGKLPTWAGTGCGWVAALFTAFASEGGVPAGWPAASVAPGTLGGWNADDRAARVIGGVAALSWFGPGVRAARTGGVGLLKADGGKGGAAVLTMSGGAGVAGRRPAFAGRPAGVAEGVDDTKAAPAPAGNAGEVAAVFAL
jgi:hypothetical protein